MEWRRIKPWRCQEAHSKIGWLFLIRASNDLFWISEFSSNIHTIHASPGKSSIIVYDNGYSESLKVGLTKRKDVKPNLLEQGETVSKSYLERVKDQTVLILSTSKNKVYILIDIEVAQHYWCSGWM